MDALDYMVKHLASYGYIVISPNFPLTNTFAPGGVSFADVVNQPGDVSFVIDELLEMHANPESIFFGAVDGTRIGVMGVSAGGETTSLVSFHPTWYDPRVKAAVVVADPFAQMYGEVFYDTAAVPLLLIFCDGDLLAGYEENALTAFALANSPVTLLTIVGGTHTGFADPAYAPPFVEWIHNPDSDVCEMIAAFPPPEIDFYELFGGESCGIVMPIRPMSELVICSSQPTDLAIRPSRQREVTQLATLSFFQSYFASDPAVRFTAAQYLHETYAQENADVTVQSRLE